MIRGLLFVVCLILLGNVIFVFASPVVKNRMLEGKMQELVKQERKRGEDAVRRDLMAYIHEQDIPLRAEQIEFSRTEAGIVIAARYTDHVEYFFLEHEYELTAASHRTARTKLKTRKAAASGP